MVSWIKNVWTSFYTNLIWREGRAILISALILTVLFWFLYKPLALVGIIFVFWSFYFFRNPQRICFAALSDDTILVCPADGRVVDITYDPESNLEGYAYKVSIFLSAFDVHVNWIPVAGEVVNIHYKSGVFMFAFLPKSSLLNERNDAVIEGKDRRTILVRQIAGLIARRICCWVNKGEHLTVGQKYGMIKFGSRVDIFLPNMVVLEVKKGQYVYGGQTILGRWICY